MTNLTQEKGFTKTEFAPIPEGDYKVRLVDFVIKENKLGTGLNGCGHFEIVNGDFKKRRVFHNFLISNPSEKAVQISEEKMNKFLTAVGEDESIEDMGYAYDQLMDKVGEVPFIVKLVDNEYTDRSGKLIQGSKISEFRGR